MGTTPPTWKRVNASLPLKKSMHCHTSLHPPLYNLYTWKLNHSQTIWDKKGGVIGNILMNTLETENNY